MYDCVNYNLQMHVRDVPPIPPPPPNIEKKNQKQIKVKVNNTLIFQYEQQNIQNHGVFDKKKNEYAELCHVVNFEYTGWQ